MAPGPAGYTPVILQSGTPPLTASGVGAGLYRQEAALPEGSLMQLTLTVAPVFGADVAETLADLFNQAVATGTALGASGPPVPWPGTSTWATGGAGTLTIRWRKGQPQILVVVALLGALVLAGVVIWGLITHWSFLHWVATPVSPGGADWGPVVLIGGGVLVGLLLLGRLAHPR